MEVSILVDQSSDPDVTFCNYIKQKNPWLILLINSKPTYKFISSCGGLQKDEHTTILLSLTFPILNKIIIISKKKLPALFDTLF